MVAQLSGLEVDPDNVAAAEPLADERLDLDSLDRVELMICIEEAFGVALGRGQGTARVFTSIASLADFIQLRSGAAGHQAVIPSHADAGLAAPRRATFSFAQIFSDTTSPPPDAIQG